jgi:hypothetical protein
MSIARNPRKRSANLTLSIEAQGTVLVARDNRRLTVLKHRAAAKRGTVRFFSKASRRRLIEMMARLDVAHTRTTFLTLTFSSIPSPQEAKRAFKAFTMRMRRKFPKMSAFWRMEHQERGSIHFHLICFGMPYWSQQQIQYAWECCTGEEMSIAHVKLLRGGKRQAMFYVAKYIAKNAVIPTSLDTATYSHGQENASEEDPGRFWGYLNKKCLPFAKLMACLIDDDSMIQKLWLTASMMTRGRAAQQERAMRFYGTCCYGLLSIAVEFSERVLWQVTHELGDKIQWFEVDHSLAFA